MVKLHELQTHVSAVGVYLDTKRADGGREAERVEEGVEDVEGARGKEENDEAVDVGDVRVEAEKLRHMCLDRSQQSQYMDAKPPHTTSWPAWHVCAHALHIATPLSCVSPHERQKNASCHRIFSRPITALLHGVRPAG